jgi:hypothetical protein
VIGEIGRSGFHLKLLVQTSEAGNAASVNDRCLSTATFFACHLFMLQSADGGSLAREEPDAPSSSRVHPEMG